MLRPGAICRKFNKKTFLALGILAILLVFYLMFIVNYCVINNIHKFIQESPPNQELVATRPSTLYQDKLDDSQTDVRLVPLVSWTGLKDILVPPDRNESVDGAPKYRFLRQQSLRAARRLPQALIIGVKKSGTRALLEFIRLHPDVRAAGSEVHFFDRHYERGFNWYRRHMPATLEGQVTMEKTPSYFVTREAPARVHQMDPSTRLLVVVRDPVTRAISDYTQAISKKTCTVVKRFEELAFVNGSVWGSVDTSWGPVRIGVYARHLQHWRAHFPLHQMLFVSGERLIVDPAAEMARVQDFLGLKRVVTEKYFYFNATKGFPCLMKSEGRASPHCLGKTKGRNHPHIRPAALERLRDFYRPFNLRFYQLTGINFGWP